MADFTQLDALRSVEELGSLRGELTAEATRMVADADGRPFSEDDGSRFADVSELVKEIDRRVDEIIARQEMVESFAKRTQNTERLNFHTSRPGATRTEDIYDLSNLPAGERGEVELRERAKRSIDSKSFPDPDAPAKVQRLVEQDMSGEVSRRILTTGSPTYLRAFGKMLVGREHSLTNEERTSMSLTVGAGGYAVPYILDPSVVLTSNGQINPVRQMAHVVTITGNDYRGIASTGITASYDAELTEVSDDSPGFTQPAANVEKAQAFVAYSLEIGEDWGALSSEMARLLADAKDSLEASKFLTGLGHSANEPEGLLVGATGTVLTDTASVIAIADLYEMTEAVAPRWRARAQWAGGLAAFNKIRSLDQYGGSALWAQLGAGTPAVLLGKQANEWSNYSGAITTAGSSVLTFGDFGEFTIVDRVGMNVEFIPHIFATANNRPAGQRGLYAYWRNTSDVRTAAAFRTLKIG